MLKLILLLEYKVGSSFYLVSYVRVYLTCVGYGVLSGALPVLRTGSYLLIFRDKTDYEPPENFHLEIMQTSTLSPATVYSRTIVECPSADHQCGAKLDW